MLAVLIKLVRKICSPYTFSIAFTGKIWYNAVVGTYALNPEAFCRFPSSDIILLLFRPTFNLENAIIRRHFQDFCQNDSGAEATDQPACSYLDR